MAIAQGYRPSAAAVRAYTGAPSVRLARREHGVVVPFQFDRQAIHTRWMRADAGASRAPMLSAQAVLARLFVFGVLGAFIGLVYLALPVGPGQPLRFRAEHRALDSRNRRCRARVRAGTELVRTARADGSSTASERRRTRCSPSCRIEWRARTRSRTFFSTWRRSFRSERVLRRRGSGCESGTSSCPPRNGPRTHRVSSHRCR